MKVMSRVVGMKQTSDLTFQPDWLALREPADHAARDQQMLRQAAQVVPQGARILDLGSGTGSTARAFAAAGWTELSWRFFDNDPLLLAEAQAAHPNSEIHNGDLADVANIPLDGIGLVTASALLDLMPSTWVEALAQRLAARNIPFYAALNYDGDMRWTPARDDDAAITEAFNTHQRIDKGNGPALGPKSGAEIATVFAAHGYTVTRAKSPWVIGPDQAALHAELLAGIGSAASEIDAALAPNWAAERRGLVDRSQATIGHDDILAIPHSVLNVAETGE